ncbi:MAG TPA: efflux transporter outer membrane subunit [Bordetella sp.]
MNARLASTLAALLAALALAGCAPVGPDYRLPDQAVANRGTANAAFRQQAADARLYSRDEAPAQWWRLYNDPQLDDLVRQALQANADLRQAAANLERAQAVADQARGKQDIETRVDANPFYGHQAGTQFLQPGLTLPNEWMYSASAGVSYQVDLFGQIHRAIEAANADSQAAQAALDAARVTVAAETARAYASLCAAGMQLDSANRSVQVQRESLEAVRTLAGNGRGTALDVTRAQAQLDQLQANLPPFQARQRSAFYLLAALTGRTPADMPQSLLACKTPPRLTHAIPVGDGALLLRRRPDVRQAERSLAAATARIGVATADLYPKITLGLSAMSLGPADIVGQGSTINWSMGPLISWTLPTAGAHARVAQARAQAKGALARFDAVVLKSLQETETALTVYARELDRVQALQAARQQSGQAARQARQLLAAGKTDYLSVLDAERTLAGAQSALAASQAELSADQIAVFLALGGGWEVNAP